MYQGTSSRLLQFVNGSTVKIKSAEATVYFLFSYEMCLHRSKYTQPYKLHVREGTIHHLRDILCVARTLGLHGDVRNTCVVSYEDSVSRCLQYSNEVKILELFNDSSRHLLYFHI